MVLRRERQAVEGEAVIRVRDIYGRAYYIDRKKFMLGSGVLMPIYHKWRGKFYRNKQEICLHRENIIDYALFPTCEQYKHFLDLLQEYTGLVREVLRDKYGLYTYEEIAKEVLIKREEWRSKNEKSKM